MDTEDFKRIFESLRVAVVVADPLGTIAFANSAFGRLASQEAKEMAGTDLLAFFADEDRVRARQNVARVGEGKAVSAFFDAMLTPKDKTPHWVSVALQPAFDARNKAAGVVAILQDIGSQRETDDALNLVTARLLAFAEASPVAVMIETAPGDIELVNDAFCRLLGLESAPQSLSGLPAMEVLERSPFVDAKALKAAHAKPGRSAQVGLRLADGRSVTLERRPISVETGPGGALWIPRDEAAVARTAEKGAAEIALIEKIGMELSVAMEAISAISIRAQQMEIDPAMVDLFKRIRTSTETAMAAIGDLVDFSALSGRVVLHKETFALRLALADLIARLGPDAEERGCTLRIKVEQDVADSLEGDVDRLLLVMKNLIENVFTLLPGSEVTLQITPEYVTESGIQLSFAVIAGGDGAQHPSRVSADSGMGVAVAKFMVAAMGGKLAIAARATTEALYAFTIEFPVRPAPPVPPRATYVSLVALQVLVVSGNPEQRLQLSNLLRGWRMVPLEADNAAMAMALLERMEQESTPVPLVILTNRLTGQDGFLLAFRIKNHRKLRSALVMMLATEGKPGDAIACRENGISAYMRYPVNDRQLNEAITAVTGASVDTDETPTLVTRHSLREHRKGATVLLVDPSRDSQILAAHVLGRHDCSLVVAQDLTEAIAALDADLYDMVIVDTSLKGLAGDDAAKLLRSHILRDAETANLVAASLEHSPAFRAAKTAIGFKSTIAKPFRKDDLLGLLNTLAQTVEAG